MIGTAVRAAAEAPARPRIVDKVMNFMMSSIDVV
jgi:hypothetical protein